jgi:hypothetical protein
MQLIYLSPVPWASFAQRPHKFVQWFHEKTNAQILWINPYPARFPVWQDIARKAVRPYSSQDATPRHIHVIQPRCIPIEPLYGSGYINSIFWKEIFEAVDERLEIEPTILGIGKPSELALRLLSRKNFKSTIYDAMDDFPAFHRGLSSSAMLNRERLILDRVTQILVSSSTLQARWSSKSNVSLVRNACDVKALSPSCIRLKTVDPQVIGYVGTIGNWFDWNLVLAIARAKPHIKIRLIGPMYCVPPNDMPSNIEIRPQCSHADAILAMRQFSVGLIPFIKNKLTESVDPIKYYEYRALGLPVLSTAFGEMLHHGQSNGVFIMDKHREIKASIDAALAYLESIDQTEQFRKINSWDQRFMAANICV